LAAIGRSPRELEAIVRRTTRLSSVERVDIYANMYFYRILDVLREEYATVLAALGENAFHNLVTDYLVACRPAHPSLREVGARLPAFLAQHPVAEGRAWVAELARLERTHLELYDGPDASVVTLDELRALPADTLPAFRLRAIPCHAVLRNRFAVGAAWKALGEGGATPMNQPTPQETPEVLVVWRQGIEVFHQPVEPDEEALLESIRDGAPFDVLCEQLIERVLEAVAAERAFQILGRWVSDELIAAPG
jgi:hypothetical protein